MIRNSGIIGARRNPTQSLTTGVYDTFDNYNARRKNQWPVIITYSLSANSGTIFENTAQSFTLSTTGYDSNTILYWTILNGSTTNSDFYNSVVSGSFTQSGTTNTGAFSVITSFIGNTSKTTRTFQIQIRTGSISGTVVYTSGTFSIPPITISGTSVSTTSVNEGGSFSINWTLGQLGNYLSYNVTIANSGTATLSSSDFTSWASSFNTSGSTNYSLTYNVSADSTTEGSETVILSFVYNNTWVTFPTVTINDTSQTPTASLNPSANPINEGSTMTFTVTTTNFPSGTLYWTLENVSNWESSDQSATSGSFTISSSSGSFNFTITSDGYTEGTEQFLARVRINSTSGTIIGTSATISISDTSTGTPEPTGYVLTAGTKAPVFGSGGGTYPPSGWTGLQNGSVDDSFVNANIPSFTINSSSYTTVSIGSNTYLTFGGGSTNYSGLSSSNPALNKIHMGAADNSYQRVSTVSSGTDYTRIRYEGTASTGGSVGSPNIVYEATFFNSSKTGGNPTVEVLFGSHNRTTGQAGIANTASYYATYSQAANQSYVFVGNSTGTSWTIYTGYYMAGTGY
jgi:hypothetical protein